jgi:hypothetical protein
MEKRKLNEGWVMQNLIEKETINKITRLSKIRESAFFTFMRQSGLTPISIKKLKIRNIEKRSEFSCKIFIPQE